MTYYREQIIMQDFRSRGNIPVEHKLVLDKDELTSTKNHNMDLSQTETTLTDELNKLSNRSN